MKLVIGGSCQGKREYIIGRYGIKEEDIIVWEQALIPELWKKKGIYQVQRLLRQMEVSEFLALTEQIIHVNPQVIFLCDEIGYGIVPAQKEDRDYRERAGRAMCALAERAEEVIRVVCGIGQKIK